MFKKFDCSPRRIFVCAPKILRFRSRMTLTRRARGRKTARDFCFICKRAKLLVAVYSILHEHNRRRLSRQPPPRRRIEPSHPTRTESSDPPDVFLRRHFHISNANLKNCISIFLHLRPEPSDLPHAAASSWAIQPAPRRREFSDPPRPKQRFCKKQSYPIVPHYITSLRICQLLLRI